jgi:carbon monoxide dehydrogenase subunit G
MRSYKFTEHIDRPPQAVWAALVDLTLAPRWRPAIRSMETTDGGPVRAGSKLKITMEFMGRRESRVTETVVFEPPRRWVVRSSDKPAMEGFFEFIVEPERSGSGTRVTATADLKAHEFLAWLFLPLVARGERKRRLEMLGNLKRLVEALPG